MHQDEHGRWVSDDGRYRWSGTEWVDLEGAGGAGGADDAPEWSPGRVPGGATTAAGTATAAPAASAAPPAEGPSRSRSARPTRSRRPLLLLIGLVVLVALGVGAVLLVGRNSGPSPRSAVASPPAVAPAPLPSSSVAAPPVALDEQQRRTRGEAALLHRPDLAGTTEERAAKPTDVFLPCRAPALGGVPGTVLLGQRVSNSDFSVYAGQTIAAYPTARDAGEALVAVRRAISRCDPYDFDYANSSRVDHITYGQYDPALAVGEGGAYLEELDTPANYSGTPTGYSYGYVQRGQFLIRLTLSVDSKVNRPELERLMRLCVDRLS